MDLHPPHLLPPSVPSRGWVWVLGGLCLAGLVWALVQMTWGRALAWDEVEFVRATEWVRVGKVPFRDFWEHHAPLHWFLMAPFKTLAQGPGVNTVLAMRWAQIPLWAVSLWALDQWMEDGGQPRWSRWAGGAALLSCPLFVLWALQYRVDVSALMLALVGFLGLLRAPGSRAWAVGTGVLLVGAGLANLRFIPMAGAALLIAPWVDLRAQRWRWQAWTPWVGLGAGLAGAIALAYFSATNSGAQAWSSLIEDNAMADRLLPKGGGAFWNILALPVQNGDLASGLLLLAGGVGLLRALGGLRTPGPLQFLALIQGVNLLFIHRMKVTYIYHFQLVLMLMVPFLAEVLTWLWTRMRRPNALLGGFAGLLAIQAVGNASHFVVSRESRILAYQDQIMREADRATTPGERILDGCGWALQREPAYRRWFLALNVRLLSRKGRMEYYPPEEFLSHPPGAIILNGRLVNWLQEWPNLGRRVVTHYLPTLPNLWLPGLSARLEGAHRSEDWVVPRSGSYEVAGSLELAAHPWFNSPLQMGIGGYRQRPGVELEMRGLPTPPANYLRLEKNGQCIEPRGRFLQLSQGDRLRAEWSGPGALGLLLVPVGRDRLFRPGPVGVNLEEAFYSYYRDDS